MPNPCVRKSVPRPRVDREWPLLKPSLSPTHFGNERVERRFHLLGPHRSHLGAHTGKHAVTMLLVELLSHEPHHEPRLVGAKAHHAVTGHAPPLLGANPFRGDGQHHGLLLSEVGP